MSVPSYFLCLIRGVSRKPCANQGQLTTNRQPGTRFVPQFKMQEITGGYIFFFFYQEDKIVIILHKRNHQKQIHLFAYNPSILGIPDADLSLPRKCLSSQAIFCTGRNRRKLWWKEQHRESIEKAGLRA